MGPVSLAGERVRLAHPYSSSSRHMSRRIAFVGGEREWGAWTIIRIGIGGSAGLESDSCFMAVKCIFSHVGVKGMLRNCKVCSYSAFGDRVLRTRRDKAIGCAEHMSTSATSCL